MEPVRMVFEKWGGGRHWEHDALVLGSDRHGVWLGVPAGTTASRPGASFASSYDHVQLLPDAGFVAAFYADVPEAPVALYVDIATPPHRDGAVFRAVDLDLDVVRGRDGAVWVDDEDEFAEHRVRLGYPQEVAEAAERSCAAVLHAVRAGEPPFDPATGAGWLARLAARRP
ncbi:MAG: DUF402 domain-containing protein [Pseudonocardia sediminis]